MNENVLAILLYISVGINISVLVDKLEDDGTYTPPIFYLMVILFWPLVFLVVIGLWLGGGYGNK